MLVWLRPSHRHQCNNELVMCDWAGDSFVSQWVNGILQIITSQQSIHSYQKQQCNRPQVSCWPQQHQVQWTVGTTKKYMLMEPGSSPQTPVNTATACEVTSCVPCRNAALHWRGKARTARLSHPSQGSAVRNSTSVVSLAWNFKYCKIMKS